MFWSSRENIFMFYKILEGLSGSTVAASNHYATGKMIWIHSYFFRGKNIYIVS